MEVEIVEELVVEGEIVEVVVVEGGWLISKSSSSSSSSRRRNSRSSIIGRRLADQSTGEAICPPGSSMYVIQYT